MASFQRVNPYNRFLPNAAALEADADQCLDHIKERLVRAVDQGDLCDGLPRALFDLHKYVLLYGLRFKKEDHVRFVRLAFAAYITKDITPQGMERIGQVWRME